MDAATIMPPEQIHEHEGILWKPKPGATSSFEEFLHARVQWLEIWHETDWNPWREEELAPQLARAEHVTDEWERAERDFRPLSKRQIGARMGAIKRKVGAEREADEARWERDKTRYDADREKARFALLEREVIHANQLREIADYRSGVLYPSMDAHRRTRQIAELEASITTSEQAIARLSTVVGDREDVVDENGRLPRDRRSWNLIWYRYERKERVGELQQSTAELRETLATTQDRKEKSSLQSQLYVHERRLRALLAVPRLEADQMCADCLTPQSWHVYGRDISESCPCPRWPIFAARTERVWEILRSASDRVGPAEPAPPKPQPLATLP
ncbi:hypothetical protein [Agromyces bauzanensis]|nr:hypothetical protein [Agromyces bauzanensis]